MSTKTSALAEFKKLYKETLFGYALVLPAVLLTSILILYPIAEGVYTGFHGRSFLNPDQAIWIGLENYYELWADPLFWHSLKNSVVLTTVVVASEFVLGLGLALLLKQRLPGMRFFRSVSMITWVMPIVVTVIIFNWMIHPSYGIVNIILESLGFESKYWLGDEQWALPIIMSMYIWRNAPFFAVALMARMQSIPEHLYEAAEIDGAGPVEKFRYITLPNIVDISVILIVLFTIFAFNNFEYVYLGTGGGPARATEILPTYVYKEGFQKYALGYASAIGTVMLVIMLVFAAAYVRMVDIE